MNLGLHMRRRATPRQKIEAATIQAVAQQGVLHMGGGQVREPGTHLLQACDGLAEEVPGEGPDLRWVLNRYTQDP